MESSIPGTKPTSWPDLAAGDWMCPDATCGNVNFARRETCNRCNIEKSDSQKKAAKLSQEIGKVAADKSRGLFSADDWQCSKCGNVNWARRQTCNMCNAPKFGEVEERTGLGGGYNDRGVVEYVERRDSSDDEYDEFGRRKKKRTASEIAEYEKQKALPSRAEPDDDDDEEEDSDDDDGDLSKYDLSGWGEDEAPKEDRQKQRDEGEREGRSRGKRSRSRSSSRGRRRNRSRSRSRSRSNTNSRSSRSTSSRSSSSKSTSSSDRRR